MIFRGAFWMGAVWLAMPHLLSATAGAAEPGPAHCRDGAGCADPVAGALTAWRTEIFASLGALKTELDEAQNVRLRGVSGTGKGEAVLGYEGRLANAGKNR